MTSEGKVMKWYRVQRRVGVPASWGDFAWARTQSVKYARGVQDALQWAHPTWMTRIVRENECRLVEVRRCGNWAPCRGLPKDSHDSE